MIRIGISGIAGRMGQRIAYLTLKDKDLEVKAALERENHDMINSEICIGEDYHLLVSSDLEAVSGYLDCFIEFTFPEPTLKHLEICKEKGVPMVIGTTAINEEGEKKIKEASKKIPIVYSPNMSIGVNMLFKLVSEAARVLAEDFSIKVDETHHIHKKDSPSGTAKMIAKVIKEASGKDVPIEAFREGEVAGNHGVLFESEFETLEVRHDAKNRDVFASGALRAAKFVAGKKPGLYSMFDVLGLTKS